MTSNERAAGMLVIVAALAAMALLLSGCGRNDQYRGHNANMIGDGIGDVRKVLKEKAPRLYAEHPTLKRDLDDIEDRNNLSKKDHPWRGAKIERHTPEKPSPMDVNLYCAYSAVVDKKDADRRASAERWAWWHYLIWWLKAALYASPFIGLIWLFLYVRKHFFQVEEVQVKHIQATVPDKDERREIAGGSPTERVFKKIKGALTFWRKKRPQDALTRDNSDQAVSEAKEPGKTPEIANE
jgi:hypothetical protein